MTIIILLYRNEILCESYITVKINKIGQYKVLFKGGIEQTDHYCYGVSMHIPNSMKINGNKIDPPINEFNFTEQQNTIKLVYD